jgi:REP element-mobilizing transposase RayT
MTCFITFSCYATHLHGDEGGSVDRDQKAFGSPLVPTKPGRSRAETELMDEPRFELDAPARRLVLETIRQVSEHRGWTLLAAHVRRTHIHAVVEGEDRPGKMMNAFKAYASRRLNEEGTVAKRWARHGSTRWLWRREDVRRAIQYVVEEQGAPMAVFVGEEKVLIR